MTKSYAQACRIRELEYALIKMTEFARGYISEMDEGEAASFSRAVTAIANAEIPTPARPVPDPSEEER